MLLINCPWCGPRDETEFGFGGEAHRARPADPSTLSDAQWAEFLFYRDNTKGAFAERWLHSTGCRQWFNMLRDTVTYDIQAVYPMGTPRPDGAGNATARTTPDTGTASTAADSTTTGTAAPDSSGTSAAPAGTSSTSTTAPEGATK